MASFLQNNGDIILDAVLTDYGRELLARGDGSFNIVKFAFGDDEIDYGLFNANTSSIYQDKEIMDTPILEAFTNNAASMKSQLITIGIENLLFMPVLKMNERLGNDTGQFKDGSSIVYSGYVVPVDVNSANNPKITSNALTGTDKKFIDGVLNVNSRHIAIDQGLDSTKLNPEQSLKDTSPMLYETEYNIYVDNRFCSVGNIAGGTTNVLQPLSVDDDNIAIYKLTEGSSIGNTFISQIKYDSNNNKSVIGGTKGSRLMFTVVPNSNLVFTDTMFDKYGKVLKLNEQQATKEFKTIRMPIRIVGVTTGYSVEIPVLFAKVNN